MATTKPLTKAEKAWLKELQAVLDKQPTARLAFAATGDCDLCLFDRDRYSEISNLQDSRNSDWTPAASEIKADFDGFTITFKNQVESTAA